MCFHVVSSIFGVCSCTSECTRKCTNSLALPSTFSALTYQLISPVIVHYVYRKTSNKRRVSNKRWPLINAGGSDVRVLINAGSRYTSAANRHWVSSRQPDSQNT